MKKSLKKCIATVCALTCVGSTFVGCGKGGGPMFAVDVLEVDATKTPLYIGNYSGGMGSRWLDEFEKGFEELYKEVSFEEGKKGVDVVVDNDKQTYEPSSIEKSIDGSIINVYFTERANYYKFINEGLIMDISSAVTKTISGESKSIEGKLTQTQQGYYKVDGKYYGLPHYRSFRGIVYDKDLFNEKKLYIKADGNFGAKEGEALSYGPNGQPGGGDDGLPATYDEFFAWCYWMKNTKQVTPIIWNGENKESYTKHLLDALHADASGVVEASTYYNVPQTPTNVRVVTGFTGETPNVQTVALSRDNYTMAEQLMGNYYSLNFLDRLVKGNYYYNLSMNSSLSHVEAQRTFLHSRFDGVQPIAMMVEGTWWEEEANELFEGMKNFEGASRSERSFGFLPMPKPDASYAGTPTLYDANKSIVMVNANCEDKPVQKDLALKFIEYISTDANLQLFNSLTGIGRDYAYEMTPEQQTTLTSFAKDIYNFTQSGSIVYGYNMTKSNYAWSETHELEMRVTSVGGESWSEPVNAFYNGITAQQYFQGVIDKNK